MAENTKFGREPIQVVQIDQDFCTRTFGDISTGCPAGDNQNLVEKSVEIGDQNFWISDAAADYSGVGPDGISDTVKRNLSTLSQGSFYNYASPRGSGTIQNDTPPLMFWHFLARKFSGPDDGARIRTRVNVINYDESGPGDSSTMAYCNPVTGDIVDFFGDPIPGAASESVGDGYFKFSFQYQATVSRSEYEANLLIQLEGGYDETVELTMVSITNGKEYPYIQTYGNAFYPTDTVECFNTRSTCPIPDYYDKGVLPLQFIDKRAPIPVDDYYIPSLTGVSVTPAKLNPGGANSNAGALGQRASLSISFRDHPHNDRMVDKYRDQRPYDPKERGTFWTKWRARNPYYMQRPIKLRSGYLKDGDIVEEITRDFVITGFAGPDAAGNVQIQGKDVLTLAEDEKAQAPIASTGKLSADITAGATSATLTPSGVGDDEYPASGEVRIGKEVMSFTRSGDNLTLTRGQFGTEAKAHDEDDTVQLCLRYVSQAPQDILEDLLTNYANIPAQYIDKAQWDAEALDFLPRLYSAIITEPQGVSKLISEMCQQMYFTIWWDERLGKIVLKSVRLAQEDEVFELDDQKHLIADSISWKDLADELITQVWVYYGQIDPTEKIDQGSNYSTIAITADPDAEGADKHNLRRIKTIFSRWIDATNASAAEDLGARILDRYGNAPRQVTFRVDAKDDYLWLGDYIRLTNRLRVNRFGQSIPVNLQIFEAEEATLGSEYKFTAQEFIPALIGDDQVGDPDERTIPITSDLLNVNLRTLHDSLFGAPEGTETITFVVREGVTIGGDTAGGGTNVPVGQRVTTNDFYDGGNVSITGYAAGQLPILQRQSISSVTDTAKGANYSGVGNAAHLIREYPVVNALETGSWTAGVTLNLIVEAGAIVSGQGGNGSAHFSDTVVADGFIRKGIPGGDGGHALKIDNDISITNGGIIAGGGAGGGVYVRNGTQFGEKFLRMYGAGGGAGLEISDVRTKNIQQTISSLPPNRDATPGSVNEGGQSTGVIQSDFEARGGRGGNLAAAGQSSRFRREGGTPIDVFPGAGGLAGKAVSAGASMITWVNKGDVRGDEVS